MGRHPKQQAHRDRGARSLQIGGSETPPPVQWGENFFASRDRIARCDRRHCAYNGRSDARHRADTDGLTKSEQFKVTYTAAAAECVDVRLLSSQHSPTSLGSSFREMQGDYTSCGRPFARFLSGKRLWHPSPSIGSCARASGRHCGRAVVIVPNVERVHR